MRRRSRYIIIIMFACVAVVTHAQQHHSDRLDNILRLVPLATLYTMRVAGVENNYSWQQSVAANVVALGVTYGVTQSLKLVVDEERPDGSDYKSFPSGHAAIAFAGAHSLHKEYGHLSPWVSVAGYSVATFVAVDRIAKDRHHWYDVAAGAAIGLATSELSYQLSKRLFRSDHVGMAFSGQQLDVIVNL